MGGGSQAKNVTNQGMSAANTLDTGQAVAGNSAVQQALQDYSSGKSSYADAMSAAKQGTANLNVPGWGEGNGQGADQALSNLFQTGAAGNQYAAQQVQNNPLLNGLFGEGGQLQQNEAEATRLQNQGFQLTPEDHEAYGQASGNIARLFGQQEGDLSQSLANRGLASAPSGAAGASFTGLQGNKNEQLANAQMNIANQRMQNTMQRLAQTQNFISSLGGQAQSAQAQQYGAQQQGANRQDQLNQQNFQNQKSIQDARQSQENQGFQQQQSTAGPGLGAIAGGVGMDLLGAATGGVGSALSSGMKGLAGGLFNSKPSTDPSALEKAQWTPNYGK